MFDADLAEIRFGFGRAPGLDAPVSIDAMLAGLTGPDDMQSAFPIETFETFRQRMVKAQAQNQIRRKNRGTPAAEAARKQRNLINKDARIAATGWICLLYTSPSPRDRQKSRMPSSA